MCEPMVFNNQYSIGDIVNACLLIVTLATLFYTISLNRKVLKLSFRPYVDLNPLPNQYGYEITHVDGLGITVYNNPIQIRFMKVYLAAWHDGQRQNEQKEFNIVDDEIVMPSVNAPSSVYQFHQVLEWLRESKQNAKELTMHVWVSYSLIGDSNGYVLHKRWAFKGNEWIVTEIKAT